MHRYTARHRYSSIAAWLCVANGAALLAGCATSSGEDAGYPSLARRPIERAVAVPVPPPAPAATLAADIAADIAALVARSRSANATFTAEAGTARQRVTAARGAATGSENWVVAQLAISRADAARTDTRAALADIDAIIQRRALSGDDAGGAELIRAQQQIAAEQAEQDQVIAALLAALDR